MISQWAQSTFKSLGHRHYRILWIGTSLSFLAFMMSFIVQSVVAFDLTGKNGAVGFVSLGMGISTVAIAPFGGVLADRVSKRRLLIVGQALIGLNFAFIGFLIITGHVTIWWLAGSTFVMGAVFSFIAPARQAWIGDLLPAPALANGIALQQMAMTATRIFGPFLAGGLIALSFVGTGGTYLFMAGIFVIVMATLARLPATQGRVRGTGPSVLADFRAGLQHLAERPRLKLLALSFIGVIIAGFSFQVVLPGLLQNELGRDPKDMSILFGASAIAGFIVTLVVASLADSRHAWRIMVIGGLTLGVALVLTAAAPNFWWAVAAMLLVGAGSSGFQLLNNALVMQETDPAYYGRVMSVTMLAWGANGLVAYPFGALADRIGERDTLLVMGVLVTAVMLATAASGAFAARRPRPMAPPLAPELAHGKPEALS